MTKLPLYGLFVDRRHDPIEVLWRHRVCPDRTERLEWLEQCGEEFTIEFKTFLRDHTSLWWRDYYVVFASEAAAIKFKLMFDDDHKIIREMGGSQGIR